MTARPAWSAGSIPSEAPGGFEPSWRARWPAFAILASCTFLQRFGVHVGDFPLPAGILVLAIVCGILAVQGRLRVAKTTLLAYVLFAVAAGSSTVLAYVEPPPSTATSIGSLGLVLLFYVFLAFRWEPTLGLWPTLALFRWFVGVLAICGCLQFALQAAGIYLFSFRGVVPEAFLLEPYYNVVIPVAEGAPFFKSNGFFLLEPSCQSQIVALGLALEILYFGRPLRMALLAFALLTTVSGTGIVVLAFALLASTIERGNFGRVLKLVVLATFVFVVFSTIAPEYVAKLASRSTEIQSEETSGFLRYVSPYLMVADVARDPRFFLGYGPGTAERFELGYEYAINAITKLLVEYGVAGLGFYVLLYVSAISHPRLRVLSAVGFVWFVFGGGYLVFPGVVYTLAVLFSWGPGDPEQERVAPHGATSNTLA